MAVVAMSHFEEPLGTLGSDIEPDLSSKRCKSTGNSSATLVLAAHSHALFLQVAPAPQLLPQEPQLSGSVVSAVSQPGWSLQLPKPAAHLNEQLPPSHAAVPLGPSVHAGAPHVPQGEGAREHRGERPDQ